MMNFYKLINFNRNKSNTKTYVEILNMISENMNFDYEDYIGM